MDAVLTADSLRKRFGDVTAVDGISFDVHRGEIFGFLGPNGAGKTTTIKMLSGLLKPDGGEVRYRYRDGAGSIGLCPQNIVVWMNLTCLEQLVYMGGMYGVSPWESKRRAVELLGALGLAEKSGKLAKTLSGGMQRRLNIALALIHSPEIVFMDEPQAGLDPQSRILVRDYIRGIRDRTTVILTTHDMEEAEKLSDRICIIDKGKVLETGTIDEIKKRQGREDLVEVEIEGDVKSTLLPYLSLPPDNTASPAAGTAFFRTGDPLVLFGEILDTIRSRGIITKNLRLRKRSLEDIFIEMTGRSLRE